MEAPRDTGVLRCPNCGEIPEAEVESITEGVLTHSGEMVETFCFCPYCGCELS